MRISHFLLGRARGRVCLREPVPLRTWAGDDRGVRTALCHVADPLSDAGQLTGKPARGSAV